MKKEEKTLEDYKFSDFMAHIQPMLKSDVFEEEWFKKANLINTIIKQNNVQDKITFLDDRLVLIAWKIGTMIRIEPTEREYAIMGRYDEVFGLSENEMWLTFKEEEKQEVIETKPEYDFYMGLTDEEQEQWWLLKDNAELKLKEGRFTQEEDENYWRGLVECAEMMLDLRG